MSLTVCSHGTPDSALVRPEAEEVTVTEDRLRADLYDKIAEQSEVIRNARQKLRKLLDDEPVSPGEDTTD